MATPEKKVKQHVRQILSSFGAYSFMPATHGYGASGTHDIVTCYQGRFVSIETKATEKQKPTALQTRAAEQVIAAGGIALLIHEGNTDVVRTVLRLIEMGDIPASSWPGVTDV